MKKTASKTVSALVAAIFLWNQIAWAADLYNPIDEFNEEQSQAFAPAYLQDQEASHENMIAQKQAVEDSLLAQSLETNSDSRNPEDVTVDLKGPQGGYEETPALLAQAEGAAEMPETPPLDDSILSITTQAGDVIHYQDGKIVKIEIHSIPGSDGVVICAIKGLDLMDGNDDLLNADITYPDGTIEEVRGGSVYKIRKPDNTEFEYSHTLTAPDGSQFVYEKGEQIIKASYPTLDNPEVKSTVDYFYTIGTNGDITETKLKDSERSAFYDKNGTLIRVEFNTGKVIEYDKDKNDDTDNGILSKVTDGDYVYIYDTIQTGEGETATYETKLAEIDYLGNRYFIEDNNIVEIILKDGTLIKDFELDENGYIVNGRIEYWKDTTHSVVVLAENGNIKEAYEHSYATDGTYLGSTLTLQGGTVKEYDANKNLIKTVLPDGKATIYDYKPTDTGSLAVYKRVSYDKYNFYKSYSGYNYINYTTNPTLKATFNLDSTKTYSSLYASASYYSYNDKSISLSLNLYGEKPYIYYYSYNYKTRQRTSENKYLAMTINKGTDYTVEYAWTGTVINIYLYETSRGKPAAAQYTLSSNQWNPMFSVSGTNAALTLDPASSGTYRKNESIYTDYNNPLKGSPVHTTEFTFDREAANKFMYYSICGNTNAYNDSIYFSYYGIQPSLRLYHYDYNNYKNNTSKTIPLNMAFKNNTTYVIEAKIENNVLNLYVYEKGTEPLLVYAMENASWNPHAYSSISGGKMTVKAYDNLEIYDYSTQTGNNLSPLVFPDGPPDIVNNITPKIDYSITLPPDMFERNGDIKSGYDFGDNLYFDTFIYDATNRNIKEIQKANGKRLTYSDGLPTGVISGADGTVYTFTPGDFGSIKEIIAQRGDVRRVYDPRTGKLISLDKNGAEVLFNSDDSFDFIFGGAYLDAPTFNNDAGDGEFKKYDDAGNVIEMKRYIGKNLVYYKDKSGNEYEYDADGNLTKLIKNLGSGKSATYVYTQGIMTTATIVDGPSVQPAADDLVLIRYKDGGGTSRVVHFETRGGSYKDFNYTENGVEVTEGVYEMVDGKYKIFKEERLKKYGNDKYLYSIEENDGTVVTYEYNSNKTVSTLTIKRGGVTYTIKDGVLNSIIDKDGTTTEYYPSGWVKSKTTDGVTSYYEYLKSAALPLSGVSNNVKTVTANGKTVLQLDSYPDPNLALLLHFNGNESGVTYHGNAHFDTNDKVFGASSSAFNGGGDYLSIPDNPAWDLTGDFTIEAWVKIINIPYNSFCLASTTDDGASVAGWSFIMNPNGFTFLASNGGFRGWDVGRADANATISKNAWHHVAVVRSANAVTFYVDGTTYSGGTIAGAIATGSELRINSFPHYPSGEQYGGNVYIDEFRLSHEAKWTSGFTPPNKEFDGMVYNESGTFLSDPIEINTENMRTVSWDEIALSGTDAELRVRTSNSPYDSWGNWSNYIKNPGEGLNLGAAKYLQYEVRLSTTSSGNVSPELLLSGNNVLTVKFAYIPESLQDTPDMDFAGLTVSQSILDEINLRLNEELLVNTDIEYDNRYSTALIDACTGKVNTQDLANLNENDADILTYGIIDEGGTKKKRILTFQEKNGDVTYYYYGTATTVLEDIKDKDGNNYSYKLSEYDENGIMQKVRMFYEDKTKNQTINYLNGRIDNVIQVGASKPFLKYRYETWEGGLEATVIEDYSSGKATPVRKYYVDGQLLKIIDENEIVTTYKYYQDGRISTCTLSRRGKELEVYKYSYDDEKEHTIIKDANEVKRVYDKDNKLIYVEKDSKIYSYYYSQGGTSVSNAEVERIKSYFDTLKTLSGINGLLQDTNLTTELGTVENPYSYTPSGDFAIEELTQWTDNEGNIILYNEGEIVSIGMKDGVVISDVTYENKLVTGYKIHKTDEAGMSTYTIKDNYIYCEEKRGVKTYYYSNGWVKSTATVDAGGNETENAKYIYDVPLTLAGSNAGTTYYAHIDEESGFLALDNDAPVSLNSLTSSFYFNGDDSNVTLQGDARLDTETKMFGSSSLFLDGNDDYASIPDSDDYNFGTGDFTIDFWVKFNIVGSKSTPLVSKMSNPNGWTVVFSYNNLTLYSDWNTYREAAWTPQAGTWYHVAVVRNNSDIKFFVNGAQRDATKTAAATYNGAAGRNLEIGWNTAGGWNNHFNGYIDELRITKGIARWTEKFTVPDSAYYDSFEASGSFTSKPVEVNAKEFKTVTWDAELSSGNAIAVQIRTGDTENPDDGTWSAWSEPITVSGSQIPSAPAKYLQYKVLLSRDAAGETCGLNLETLKIGLVANLSEESDTNLTHEVEVEESGKTYVYDGAERLSAIKENGITYAYNPQGKIKSITEAGGKITEYIYDDKNMTKLTEVVEKEGQTELHYDTENRLTKMVDKASAAQYDYYYCDGRVIKKTTFIKKQGTIEDFSGFDMNGIVINDYEGIPRIKLERDVPLEYGTGVDGELVVRNGETKVLESRTYNYTNIYIERGAVVTVKPWDGSTGGELIIRCQRDVVIDGAFDVSHCGYRGGAGGGWRTAGRQGESYTGPGGASMSNNAGGGGGGHGSQENVAGGGCGMGGGYGTVGQSQSNFWGLIQGGTTYGTPELITLYRGSGGGGGGDTGGGTDGGRGGAGGGVIKIIANNIVVNSGGSIKADGEDGAARAGGGSGGSIRLMADKMTIAGLVTAKGGFGGGSSGTGMGGGGRIRVDYSVKEGEIFPGDGNPNHDYNAVIYEHQLQYIEAGSLTSGAIEIDKNALGDTKKTAYITANMDIPVRSGVKIETRTGSVADTSQWGNEWQEATLDQFGYKVNSELDNFIQYKITLSTKEKDNTPESIYESPNIYSLDGAAIKITFTGESESEAPERFIPIYYPAVGDSPVLAPAMPYTQDDLSALKNTIYSSALEDNEPIITKFDVDKTTGKMETEYVRKKDGSVEIYDKTDGKVHLVTDAKTGAILVRYYYDETTGELKDVRLWEERHVLAREIDSAKCEISKKKVEDLGRLAEEVGAAYEDLDSQIKDIQEQFDLARAEIESMRYITYETEVSSSSRKKKTTVTIANPYYAEAMNKLILAEIKFHHNAAVAYFLLENMGNISRGRIETTADAAFTNLERQRNTCMVQILRKELTSVIYKYYLKFLGRLPSTEELNTLIEDLAEISDPVQQAYTINRTALKQKLIDESDENGLSLRKSQIEKIVQGVHDVLTDDNNNLISNEEIQALINTRLKSVLADESTVELTETDWEKIYTWLNVKPEDNMHFGQSAFLVLKELVDDYYRNNPSLANANEDDIERYVRLAIDAILIDIFTGVINPFTEGDLELSMFALSKAAKIEGLEIDAYKLDWEDLVKRVADYNIEGKEKVIVHMNSNHYVLVTGIDAEGNITYYEPNMGEKGESITVTKAEFLKIWKGYTLSNKAPPEASNKLTSLEAQRIKGSNIFLIISIVCSIISFGLSFIDNKICQILSKVFALVAVVTGALYIMSTPSFFQNLYNIFESFTSFVDLFKNVFVATFTKIGEFISGTLKSVADGSFTLSKLLPGVSNISVGEAVFNTVVSIPVTITINRGLEFMGLDERFARIVGSFFSGGISMGLTSGINFAIGGAMQGLVVSATEELGDIFGVPTEISSIIGIAGGAIISAGLNGVTLPQLDAAGNAMRDELGNIITYTLTGLEAISYAMGTTILPNIAGELAYYGIQKFGELLGIDPRISYLAGIGIGNSISAGIGSGFNPKEMWKGIIDGLASPESLSIAFSMAGDVLNLPPVLNNMVINAIMGGIEGFMENPEERIMGMFEGIMETFYNSCVTALTIGTFDPETGGWNSNWDKKYWFGKLVSFIDILTSTGSIENALEDYMAGIFRDDAAYEIRKAGGVADFLSGSATMVKEGDIWKKKVDFTPNFSLYLDPNTNEIIGRDYGVTRERGTFGINPVTGKMGLIAGTIQETNDGLTFTYHVKDSLIISGMDIQGDNGSIYIVPTDLERQTGLVINPDGLPQSGVVLDERREILYRYSYDDVQNAADFVLNFDQTNIPDGAIDVSSWDIGSWGLTPQAKQDILNYYILANGINNTNPFNIPLSMQAFADELKTVSPGSDSFTYIPLYNEFYGQLDMDEFIDKFGSDSHAAGLRQALINRGYIDSSGKIGPSFLGLRNASEMGPEFSGHEETLYNMLIAGCDHTFSDVAKWFVDVFGPLDVITNKIIKKIQDEHGPYYPADMVGFCYSGAGDPFIQAINKPAFGGNYLDVMSLVLVGTPLWQLRTAYGSLYRRIENPNVKTVVNIVGEEDAFYKRLKITPSTDYFNNSKDVDNVFNIYIKDCTHEDYFYNQYRLNDNDEFRHKVSRFIAEVTSRSKDAVELNKFLIRIGVTDDNGKYIVDVNEVTYDD